MRRNGIPKTLQISGLTWAVKLRAKILFQGERCDGLCRPVEQDILLDRENVARNDRARKNLLHESLHALFADRPEYFNNEELILMLEERLDEFIRLNPRFLALYNYKLQKPPGTR
jgi:hypothetical protein